MNIMYDNQSKILLTIQVAFRYLYSLRCIKKNSVTNFSILVFLPTKVKKIYFHFVCVNCKELSNYYLGLKS